MDAIKSLYLTTEGRLSRKQWWLGVLGLVVASIVLSLVLGLFGLSAWNGMGNIDPANTDAAAVSAAAGDMIRRGAWAGLVLFIILAYPSYCLSLKRRHDRDNAGRDLQIAMVLNLLLLLIQTIGLGYTTTDIGNGIMMPMPAIWMTALSAIIGLFGLYLLIVLGFLRGTPGSNSYGADPVLGAAATI